MFATKITDNGGFATWEEMCSDTVNIDYTQGTCNIAGINIYTDGKTAIAHADDSFCAVVGGTGSGKTCDVVVPYIYNNALAGNSLIITDVKGDIYKYVSSTLKTQGYRIRVLDFNNPSQGDAYNPLESIYKAYKGGNADQARRELSDLAEGIFSCVKDESDPYWNLSAESYFMGLVLSLFEIYGIDEATLANVLELHLQGKRKIKNSYSTALKSYYSDDANSEAYKLLVSTLENAEQTKACVESFFFSALMKMVGQDKSVNKMLSYSTFSMSDLIAEKTAVFIMGNELNLAVYGNLISALIHQWYTHLIAIADENRGKLGRQVTFILDEFGNLPNIKDYHIKMSLSRSRGISWMITVQSFAQIELQYGKMEAETIIGNISNWIFLHSPDPELNRYMSMVAGDVTDEYTGLMHPLLPVSQLKALKKINHEGMTECLMLLGRKKPFISYLPDISKYYGIRPLEEKIIPERAERLMHIIDFYSLAQTMEDSRLERHMAEIKAFRGGVDNMIPDFEEPIDRLPRLERDIMPICDNKGFNLKSITPKLMFGIQLLGIGCCLLLCGLKEK